MYICICISAMPMLFVHAATAALTLLPLLPLLPLLFASKWLWAGRGGKTTITQSPDTALDSEVHRAIVDLRRKN